MADDHHSHTQLIIEELLPQTKGFVAEGQRRLAAQEKLLMNKRETMAPQISHLKLLESEVRADEGRTVR